MDTSLPAKSAAARVNEVETNIPQYSTPHKLRNVRRLLVLAQNRIDDTRARMMRKD